MKRIKNILRYIDKHHLYPDLRIIESAAEPEVVIDGKKVLMFSSNNYLGLTRHPKVLQAAKRALEKYGVGSDGSRLLSGNLKIHRDFEQAIAKFKKGEDAIVWPSGYSANIGVISALMNPIKIGPVDLLQRESVILSDSLNHASIIDGCIMSKQKKVIYKHCDMDDLKKKLKKYKNRRKLVVTDSVFSMDGDIAPLDKIVPLCKKYKAMLMIDEAHSTGILGKTGSGSLEYFNLKPTEDVDIVLGTCSKTLAATGGFVVASKELVRYLRVASRSYVFSTAMTPMSSAALIEALCIIQSEPNIREQLWKNIEYFRNGLHSRGFNTLTSETQIIPILIGKDETAIRFSRELFQRNIFAPCVRWPAVEKNKARIRFTIMATHTNNQMNIALDACADVMSKI